MSVKKGHDASRFVEMVVEVPGTPEEVWAAIATGPGISCWFTPTTVKERAGGTIAFELGPDMASSGQITDWSPPHRLAYEEREWMEGAPPLAPKSASKRRTAARASCEWYTASSPAARIGTRNSNPWRTVGHLSSLYSKSV
jgi:uncharacterized protein YndB with AHSA1/START domain